MICRLRTLHNADVHIRRTHMGSREPKYRHRMAKGFNDATDGLTKYEVEHCGQFSWISTSVCRGRKADYTLWAQPKLFTLSNITSYNAAFTILHLCTFCQIWQLGNLALRIVPEQRSSCKLLKIKMQQFHSFICKAHTKYLLLETAGNFLVLDHKEIFPKCVCWAQIIIYIG